jgi:hypothetical protein
LENWYDEVFNEEEQNLLFDDETFEAKDNVFAPEYSPASEKTEALAEKFIKEVRNWLKQCMTIHVCDRHKLCFNSTFIIYLIA